MASEESVSDLEERVSELEKRHEVEETVQKYVRAVDSQNVELLRSIFAEDSVVDVSPGETYEGPDEIVELYEEYWAAIPLMNHLILNQVVDVNGDEAVVSSYWLSRNEGQDGQPIKGGGFYIRHLEKRDGAWVHTHFDLDIQYLRPVEGPSLREVMGFDESQPFPKDNPNFPVPFFPER